MGDKSQNLHNSAGKAGFFRAKTAGATFARNAAHVADI